MVKTREFEREQIIGLPNPRRTLILLNICGMSLNEDFENDLYTQRIFMSLKKHCKKSGKESHPKLTLIKLRECNAELKHALKTMDGQLNTNYY